MEVKFFSSAYLVLFIYLVLFTIGSGQTVTTESCPRDAVKLSVCAGLLDGRLLDLIIGKPPVGECCSVLGGLLQLDGSVCLCTDIKATILGVKLKIPVTLSLLLSACRNQLPSDFLCA